MAQLALFEGPHLPRAAAREALARGDLLAARAELDGVAEAEEAADATRLARIAEVRRAAAEDSVETLHRAFLSALAGGGPRGFLSEAEWFRVYARCVAGALAAEPDRRFRGWLGAHFAFAFASREPDVTDATRRALARIPEAVPPGSAWIEAARLAFALGDEARARAWVQEACLESERELAVEPPPLERCGVPTLDAAPPLPPLPPPVEDLFESARALEGLPGPWTRWVAVIGEIDRVLSPPSPAEEARTGPAGDDRDEAHAFLAALRAARRSRERDRPGSPGRCSDRELRARRRMQRLSPELLARYLRGVGGALF